MATPLNILIVEDSQDDADLVLHELRNAGYEVKWKRVQTEAEYLAALEEQPEVVLCDYKLPLFNGVRALDLLRARSKDIPFILISGTVGEETAVEAVKRGATDYLLKDRIVRLGTAVRRALQEVAETAQRRKLEAQFIEAQKMEVIGQLAGGVAHDFNNILMTIMGYNDLIAQSVGQDSPLQEHTAEIRLASERAAGLTRQLLVFSRKETVAPVVLDLNEVVKDHEKMLRRVVGETVEMTILPGAHEGRIKADAGYIGQVLMNLAVNARDAMPSGGRLTIATGTFLNGQNGSRKFPDAPPGECVVLSVSDTGTGMSDEVKAHLFEAFFTTKPRGKGTGLGLATCQTIVQHSGGHIAVESAPGKGTTFRIYFPGVDQPAETHRQPSQKEEAPRGAETLLVVEDEPAVRHLACSILKTHGYEVLPASNGQEALHVASEHHGSQIRLVVTDVIMPLMDGKVMAEWLRATYPDLGILFTSGYTDEALAPHGVLEEGVEFLSKPYSPATLLCKVREMLDH
ncbi:MAG TPA: response regulator [Verrucomicrobiales bacterium]|nr:response regulator [Verrucomicrobiales bacterium]